MYKISFYLVYIYFLGGICPLISWIRWNFRDYDCKFLLPLIECPKCNDEQDTECSACICPICSRKTSLKRRIRCSGCSSFFHKSCDKSRKSASSDDEWWVAKSWFEFNLLMNENSKDCRIILCDNWVGFPRDIRIL